ncbi:hypothetical protein C0993_006723 [Termitomyces sp. T159_Od127]|nr:hypothetical protein C0993_006723 [Termitomyces sp. T159_Od127]
MAPSNASRRVIPSSQPIDVKRQATGTDVPLEAQTSKPELETPKQRASSTDPKIKSVAPKQLKGASLANPNKKARKYQAIEFESDEE